MLSPLISQAPYTAWLSHLQPPPPDPQIHRHCTYSAPCHLSPTHSPYIPGQSPWNRTGLSCLLSCPLVLLPSAPPYSHFPPSPLFLSDSAAVTINWPPSEWVRNCYMLSPLSLMVTVWNSSVIHTHTHTRISLTSEESEAPWGQKMYSEPPPLFSPLFSLRFHSPFVKKIDTYIHNYIHTQIRRHIDRYTEGQTDWQKGKYSIGSRKKTGW